MQISMVLSQARGSEVKGLSDKDKTDTLLIGYINLALVALYTKFMIKTEEAIIELHDNKTLYTLDSSDSDVTVGDLPMADNDLISIIGAFDELGTSLPINDTTCTISIFTPSYNTVQIPYGAEDTYISLIYQQNPILLDTSTLCDADGVLLEGKENTLVDVPLQLLEPLLHYVGYRAHASMDASISAENNTHYMRFVSSCNKIEDSGVMSLDNLASRDVELKGFV